MGFKLKKNSLYGSSYLAERLIEKPFFLGVNGISGEPLEGKPWTLDSNPALCAQDVCNSSSLEDVVIFFLHVRQYNCKGYNFSPKKFEMVQDVISEILKKIVKEIVPENPIELDTMMAAYNLMTIFSDVVVQSYSILNRMKSTEKLEKNLLITKYFHYILFTNFPRDPTNKMSALEIVVASCLNLKHTLKYAIGIIEHNNLKNMSTTITSDSKNVKFLSGEVLDEMDDPFFKDLITEVIINEDKVDIAGYTNSTAVNFTKLEKEISERATDLHTFESLTENSIIDSRNLENYTELRNLCDNKSITSENGNSENFRKITNDFIKQFWKQRLRINAHRRSILFHTEETYFIFLFTTLVLEYLKIISMDHPEYEELLRENLTEFGCILNYIRFSEIDQAITKKTSAILSKTLEELVTDPTVQHFIEGTPAKIMLVTTKITYYLGMARNNESCVFEMQEDSYPTFSLSDLKPIEDVTGIAKIRKSKWRIALVATIDNKFPFYNQDHCPVCLSEQKKDDSCYLLCKHTLCSSCIQAFIDNEIHHCPVCRHPICEYLPSEKLNDICQALQ